MAGVGTREMEKIYALFLYLAELSMRLFASELISEFIDWGSSGTHSAFPYINGTR